MKNIILAGLVFSGAFVSAQEKKTSRTITRPKTETTASGLQFTLTAKGAGKEAGPGDKVTVHYTGKLTNDTVFDSSVKRGQPFTFKLGMGQVIKGWDEGIDKMRVGDKAILRIPPELGYGARSAGKIPPNSTLIFEVELLDVTEGVKMWKMENKDTITTESGLKYIMVRKNKDGKSVQDKSNVKVHYSGFLADGKMFDSSVERGEPLGFTIGKGMVIKGWEEGISLLKQGEKARLIIPSHLAYGERGAGNIIPPNAALIFDVELVEVTDPVVAKPFNVEGKEKKTTASGLNYYVVEKGKGKKAAKGHEVKVHYTGYFEDGKIFDSSVERGQPFSFTLGHGQVIQGWEEGIGLMQEGDKLRLVIPYQLAYGEQGRPPQIPAKATLIFDVELISVGPSDGHNH